MWAQAHDCGKVVTKEGKKKTKNVTPREIDLLSSHSDIQLSH